MSNSRRGRRQQTFVDLCRVSERWPCRYFAGISQRGQQTLMTASRVRVSISIVVASASLSAALTLTIIVANRVWMSRRRCFCRSLAEAAVNSHCCRFLSGINNDSCRLELGMAGVDNHRRRRCLVDIAFDNRGCQPRAGVKNVCCRVSLGRAAVSNDCCEPCVMSQRQFVFVRLLAEAAANNHCCRSVPGGATTIAPAGSSSRLR